jgi:sterol desaturase/sphingolipid hydroxylase (fatty acid hydroxylase superfamily)
MMATAIMAEIANHAVKEPWPSLDWASWIFDRASFVLVGSLVIGVAATVAIVWMGIVKEHHWLKHLYPAI